MGNFKFRNRLFTLKPTNLKSIPPPLLRLIAFNIIIALCKACNKLIGDYIRLKTTQEFLQELCSVMGIPITELIQIIQGGEPELQGTWVHPQVAINLGQWASPKFAVAVSKWVLEWSTGSKQHKMPQHIRRYLINRSKIPPTHFSMLHEMIFFIVAPLEELGYIVPNKLMPDISMGKLFSGWCRKNGYEPKDFPTYTHEFKDGKKPDVQARLYPNKLLADFRLHFHNEWMQKRALKYFTDKDQEAIPYIQKHIASLPAPL